MMYQSGRTVNHNLSACNKTTLHRRIVMILVRHNILEGSHRRRCVQLFCLAYDQEFLYHSLFWANGFLILKHYNALK
jgi:hypothetical protein